MRINNVFIPDNQILAIVEDDNEGKGKTLRIFVTVETALILTTYLRETVDEDGIFFCCKGSQVTPEISAEFDDKVYKENQTYKYAYLKISNRSGDLYNDIWNQF